MNILQVILVFSILTCISAILCLVIILGVKKLYDMFKNKEKEDNECSFELKKEHNPFLENVIIRDPKVSQRILKKIEESMGKPGKEYSIEEEIEELKQKIRDLELLKKFAEKYKN